MTVERLTPKCHVLGLKPALRKRDSYILFVKVVNNKAILDGLGHLLSRVLPRT